MIFEVSKDVHPLIDKLGAELYLQQWVSERTELFEDVSSIELSFNENPSKMRLVVEGERAEEIGTELLSMMPVFILLPF